MTARAPLRTPLRGLLHVAAALALLLAGGMAGADCAAAGTRIKDISSIQGVRDNQLIGYGLVIGLQGTGDTLRNSPFTEQALQSMLDRMGINVQGLQLRARNIAAVAVTANLPAFAAIGTRIDVTIASLGDATSLRGGTLLATPLSGADNLVYAVAQGQLVSGIAITGQAETLTQGVPTAGRIANGALVERQLSGQLRDLPEIVIDLNNPDFKTAAMMADVINAYTRERYGRPLARERDLRTVAVQRPPQANPARFIAELGDLTVNPDTPAKVVVDQRTGTVVIGRNVQVSTFAVTQGNLTVQVQETPVVSQPAPFSYGETVVVPRTDIEAQETGGPIGIVSGTNLQTLVNGLNRFGLKPNDIISILQAVKTAGALQAELVFQ
ncbi:MAG: flagellar biosynthesis protein FlgI [Rhizobiales bacterium 24-66-13]|jgi:flagellar P-ring protein precursor FlgI|uniref:flagellar basal body P-ring protein FlgI n=1 Tax=Roseixanthobacter finlandensis TaxID=3119922 RepID=UPI000BC63779|nr:MAG: flagellar biosynthesis protein FlgI [Rhizobiales bacterium 35-66-30]OYZ77453.1 MAG: flagellar biosynthesis protein FlgI [Rhizobiales bacterium 24-66-13]OZA99964.1 MAG: flagellar biosynthesis protein FlgI [Rhizobiales bacterium 39-66-18]